MEMRAHNYYHSGVEMETQQQQFCLKWNSFGTNLATSFSNLFKSESLADVTLFCDGVTFKAHKLILAACSKHLADLFETAPLHQNLLVILDGTSASNMSALLEFMYKGEVHVSQDALSSFLKAAECLQVKGLSIEHEKLAVAQGHTNVMETTSLESSLPKKRLKILKEEMETNNHQQHQSSPSPSYSPTMSPYQQHHFRQYDQRISTGGNCSTFENKRRSPLTEQALQDRASVLRDGSKSGRSGSTPPPSSLSYRPSPSSFPNSQPNQENTEAPPLQPTSDGRFDADSGATSLICPEIDSANNVCQDPGCPEDLRIKLEPAIQQQEEPASSTGGGNVSTNNANGSFGNMSKCNHEIDKSDFIPTSLWNAVSGKKAGSVNTPDGKKLKCPYCERLYGYETNLRAHIRQRHQGIRVPCPFCSRTFTRNNTVRRHIAREHKAELSLKAFQQQNQQQQSQVHNHVP